MMQFYKLEKLMPLLAEFLNSSSFLAEEMTLDQFFDWRDREGDLIVNMWNEHFQHTYGITFDIKEASKINVLKTFQLHDNSVNEEEHKIIPSDFNIEKSLFSLYNFLTAFTIQAELVAANK